MKKLLWGLVLIIPLAVWAGGNPGNPLRTYTVEDTVRWVLTGVERAYNEGSVEDVLRHFSPNYSDVNGVNINRLGTMFARLLQNVKEGETPFLFYNALAKVNGNQAILTATILIHPTGVKADRSNLLIAKDTLSLQRVGGRWLILKAPHLTSALTEAMAIDSCITVTQNRSHDETF